MIGSLTFVGISYCASHSAFKEYALAGLDWPSHNLQSSKITGGKDK